MEKALRKTPKLNFGVLKCLNGNIFPNFNFGLRLYQGFVRSLTVLLKRLF